MADFKDAVPFDHAAHSVDHVLGDLFLALADIGLTPAVGAVVCGDAAEHQVFRGVRIEQKGFYGFDIRHCAAPFRS